MKFFHSNFSLTYIKGLFVIVSSFLKLLLSPASVSGNVVLVFVDVRIAKCYEWLVESLHSLPCFS